jgi:hypothetical protein
MEDQFTFENQTGTVHKMIYDRRDEPPGKGCIFWPLTLIALIVWFIVALFIWGCNPPKHTSKFTQDKVFHSVRQP